MYTVYILTKHIKLNQSEKIKKKTIILARKEYQMFRIIYLRNTIVDTYMSLSYEKNIKTIGYKFENVNDYTTLELSKFLACKSVIEFAKISVTIVNERLKNEKKKSSDFEKLYKYWKNNCLNNKEFYKDQCPGKYTIISYDYKKIRDTNLKLNTEIIKKFNLFGSKNEVFD